MNIEELRDFCLSFKGTTEDFPFDETTLVFKVAGKIFLITGIGSYESVTLKCDPGKAIELREQYPNVLPGYHMSKKHWNTVILEGMLTDCQLKEWITESYNLVVLGLSTKEKEGLSCG